MLSLFYRKWEQQVAWLGYPEVKKYVAFGCVYGIIYIQRKKEGNYMFTLEMIKEQKKRLEEMEAQIIEQQKQEEKLKGAVGLLESHKIIATKNIKHLEGNKFKNYGYRELIDYMIKNVHYAESPHRYSRMKKEGKFPNHINDLDHAYNEYRVLYRYFAFKVYEFVAKEFRHPIKDYNSEVIAWGRIKEKIDEIRVELLPWESGTYGYGIAKQMVTTHVSWFVSIDPIKKELLEFGYIE